MKKFYLFLFVGFFAQSGWSQDLADFCFCDTSEMPESLLINAAGEDALDINPKVKSDGDGLYIEEHGENFNLQLPLEMFKDQESLSLVFDFHRNEEHVEFFKVGDFRLFMFRGKMNLRYFIKTLDGDTLTISADDIPQIDMGQRVEVAFVYRKFPGAATVLLDGEPVWTTPPSGMVKGGKLVWPEDEEYFYVATEMDGAASVQPSLYSFKAWSYDNLNALSLDDHALSAGISLFPNPVQDQLQLKLDLDNTFQPDKLDLMNISGHSLKSMQIQQLSQKHWKVNLADLPDGMYILKLSDQQRTIMKKFVKQAP
ncbi:MAG: T9SS type A sorting domain-containing protein [Candidatus Cyclobacteriaceae bacterium M3_2C_046]